MKREWWGSIITKYLQLIILYFVSKGICLDNEDCYVLSLLKAGPHLFKIFIANLWGAQSLSWNSLPFQYLIFFFYYFFGCIGSSLQHAGSFIAARGLFVAALGLLSSCGAWVSLKLRHSGFLSSCGAWAPECVGSVVCGTRALSLRCTSLVVVVRGLSCPVACGILLDQTHIPCIGRRILYHWTTREVALSVLWKDVGGIIYMLG